MKTKPPPIPTTPAVEFLPLTAAPPDCAFQLLADGLRRAKLENSVDLVAAFRDQFALTVYQPAGDGGEMLVDAHAMRLETNGLQGFRDARAQQPRTDCASMEPVN